ncbi:MAG: hypothetical protein HY904_13895 [Deltaproteobacteria bacterium]|nr:hypothetical protein [Deltaproteobacteria bacterium]
MGALGILLIACCSRPASGPDVPVAAEPATAPAGASPAAASPVAASPVAASPVAASPVAALPAATDCTLATPLRPGIPGSPGNLVPSDINPNGMSELALLMRGMLADMRAARELLAQNKAPPPMFDRHRRIRCAWPSDPARRNETFDALAQAYLAGIRALDAREPSPEAAYQAAVTGCRGCHEASCPGPTELIETLRLPEAAPPPP